MKALSVTLLIALVAGVAAAQTPEAAAEAPGVSVVEKGWKREVRNPAMEEDPFRANDDHNNWVLAQKEIQRQNKTRARAGSSVLPPTYPMSTGGQMPGDVIIYVYRAKFNNGGSKAIKVLDWEYTFLDADTQAELGRHTYSHKVKIRHGKTVELYGLSTAPPARVLDAKNADKQLREKYAERVRVTRIEYDDGTVWTRQ